MDTMRTETPESYLKPIHAGSLVWKLGATSGVTVGQYTGFCGRMGQFEDFKNFHLPDTNEHVFVSIGGLKVAFAEPGDSGAIACTEDGHAIGLIFGGITPKQSANGNGFTFMTPLADVFEDIRQFLGTEDVRVAQSS